MASFIDLFRQQMNLEGEAESQRHGYETDKMQTQVAQISGITSTLSNIISMGSKISDKVKAGKELEEVAGSVGAEKIEGTDQWTYKTKSDNVVVLNAADIKEYAKKVKFADVDFNVDSFFEDKSGNLRKVWQPNITSKKDYELHKKAIKMHYPTDQSGNEWVENMDIDAWSAKFDVDWDDEQWGEFFSDEIEFRDSEAEKAYKIRMKQAAKDKIAKIKQEGELVYTEDVDLYGGATLSSLPEQTPYTSSTYIDDDGEEIEEMTLDLDLLKELEKEHPDYLEGKAFKNKAEARAFQKDYKKRVKTADRERAILEEEDSHFFDEEIAEAEEYKKKVKRADKERKRLELEDESFFDEEIAEAEAEEKRLDKAYDKLLSETDHLVSEEDMGEYYSDLDQFVKTYGGSIHMGDRRPLAEYIKGSKERPFLQSEMDEKFKQAKARKTAREQAIIDDEMWKDIDRDANPELAEFYDQPLFNQKQEIKRRKEEGQQQFQETQIWDSIEAGEEDARKEDLIKRYGTDDPDEIRAIIQEDYDIEEDLVAYPEALEAFYKLPLKEQKKEIKKRKKEAMKEYLEGDIPKGSKYNPYTAEEFEKLGMGSQKAPADLEREQWETDKMWDEIDKDINPELHAFNKLSDKKQAEQIEKNKLKAYSEFYFGQEYDLEGFEEVKTLSKEEREFRENRNKQKVLRDIKQTENFKQLENEMIEKYGDIGIDKIQKIIMEEMYLEFPDFKNLEEGY